MQITAHAIRKSFLVNYDPLSLFSGVISRNPAIQIEILSVDPMFLLSMGVFPSGVKEVSRDTHLHTPCDLDAKNETSLVAFTN